MAPFLFKGVNRRRWDWTTASYPWLGSGEFPASPFFDFRPTVECDDSVWQVDDDGSNVARLVTALAAKRQNPDKFDYVLVEEGRVRGLGISIKATDGDSPDAGANAAWHRDLIQLTGAKLVALINVVHDYGQFTRVPERQVTRLLLEGLRSGSLDEARMNERLLGLLASKRTETEVSE